MSQTPLSRAARNRGAMKARTWQGAAAAALLAALLTACLAGCGNQAAPSAAFPPPRTSGPTGIAQLRALAARVTCPAFVGGLVPGGPIDGTGAGQHLAKGFTPVAAVECQDSIVQVKGRGRWVEETKRVATSGLGALMTALRKPPSHRLPDVDCPMIAVAVPWFELVAKDGKVIDPAVPRGFCGQPVAAILVVLSKLHWQTVSRTLVEKYKPLLPLMSTRQ